MDLHIAILGLLSWKSFSGYDLKRIISDSDIFYWSGNNNHIYKSLLALQKEGMVTHKVEVQESLPAKKIYSITDKGTAELRQNLLADPEKPELRKGFLIQLAWSEMLSDEEIIALLHKYEEEIDNQLRMHQEKANRGSYLPGRSQREKYIWERISANITNMYQTELDWICQTLREFRERKYLNQNED